MSQGQQRDTSLPSNDTSPDGPMSTLTQTQNWTGFLQTELPVGRRLVPARVDELAQTQPNKVLFRAPVAATNLAKGFKDYTSTDFANAVNRVANWLEEKCGRSEKFDTVGYIGPGDIRYHALLVGCVKAGYKLLLNSPRNTLAGHLSLIDATECKIWVVAAQIPVNDILCSRSLKTLLLPEIPALFDPTPVPNYPYNRTYKQARDEPLCVLHSSGTTGLPKPIVISHGYACQLDLFPSYPSIDGKLTQLASFVGLSVYNQLPSFHIAGLSMGILGVLFFDMVVLSGPAGPPTADALDAMLDAVNFDVASIAPSTLGDIAKRPVLLKKVGKLDIIGFGGGTVSKVAGDLVGSRTQLMNCLGTTEGGVVPFLDVDNKDWNYFRVHPQTGIEMRRCGIDNLYQMYTVKTSIIGDCQAIFHTFPDLSGQYIGPSLAVDPANTRIEYTAGDLFSKHSSKPDLWRYEGRSDDIVVLSNGENINPISMEELLATNSRVSEALIVGSGRFQAAAIIELSPAGSTAYAEESREVFMENLRPTVERANKIGPRHAAISIDHILVVAPQTFLRSGKLGVQRFHTTKLLHKEIDRLYASALTSSLVKAVDYNTSSLDSLKRDIKSAIEAVTGLHIEDDADLFNSGVDSLHVIALVQQLRAGIKRAEIEVDARLVYMNPSIRKLSLALYNRFRGNRMSVSAGAEVATMHSMLDKYSVGLTAPAVLHAEKPSAKAYRVILTGTTGFLGAYLLSALMSDPKVEEVWCLNRSVEAVGKQLDSHYARGLLTNFHAHKVQFLNTDLSKPNLGLKRVQYEYLQSRATHIIHNQWKVDFNQSIASFEPHIAGVRNLIDLASSAPHRCSLHFMSSISVAQNWAVSESPRTVPEIPITDFSTAAMGYGQSKLVGENLINKASDLGLLEGHVVRIGQVAGPVKLGKTGVWNRKEWLPSLIEASSYLRKLPETLGSEEHVDWVPVDMLSDIILDLMKVTSTDRDSRVYHVVNIGETKWADILTVIQNRLTAHRSSIVQTVPLREWTSALAAAAETSQNVPSSRLLDFYLMLAASSDCPDGSVRLETSKTKALSPSFEKLDTVSKQWVELWLEQWGYATPFSLGTAIDGRSSSSISRSEASRISSHKSEVGDLRVEKFSRAMRGRKKVASAFARKFGGVFGRHV